MSDIMGTQMKMGSENVLTAFNNALIAFEGRGAEYIRENKSMFTSWYEFGKKRAREDPEWRSSDGTEPFLGDLMMMANTNLTHKNFRVFSLFVGIVIGAIDNGANLFVKNADGESIWTAPCSAEVRNQFVAYIGLTKPDIVIDALINGS